MILLMFMKVSSWTGFLTFFINIITINLIRFGCDRTTDLTAEFFQLVSGADDLKRVILIL